MRLPFPVLAPLDFVKSAVEELQLGCKLSAPQIKNLILVLTAIIISGSMCLCTISLTLLNKISKSTLSHFFSYAGLKGELLMEAAVRWAVRTMNLSTMSVRLAVDDTMKHHSRGCKTIKGVYWLFDHVLQTYCNARCIVFVYLVVNECIRFPIGWRVYRQGGPAKWKLAIELIDKTLSYGLNISVVLFDSWFCVRGFIKELEQRKLRFIGDMKSSNTIECSVEDIDSTLSISLNQLFTYAKFKLKEVCMGLKSNDGERPSKVLYKTYTTVAYIKALKGKYLIVKSIDQRTQASKIFISNELSWEAQKVLEEYSYRWMIEEFFGNAKGLCGLEEACIRSEQGGALALFLVSFVDLLVSIQLWKSVQGNSEGRLPTVSAIYAAAAEDNLQHLQALADQPEAFHKMLEIWLKVVRKKKDQTRRVRRNLVEVEQSDDKEVDTSACGSNMRKKIPA
jgi:hypothetical protein